MWTWVFLCASNAQGSIAALEFTFLRCFIWVLSPSLYMVLCVTHILNCVAVLLFIAYVADEKIKCMSQVRSVTLDTWLPEQVEFISGIAVYSCYNILFSTGNTEMFFSINFGSFHFVFWSWNWPAFRWVVERHDGPKGVGEGYLFLSGFWSVVFMISSHYFWCRTGFKLSICFLWSMGH